MKDIDKLLKQQVIQNTISAILTSYTNNVSTVALLTWDIFL